MDETRWIEPGVEDTDLPRWLEVELETAGREDARAARAVAGALIRAAARAAGRPVSPSRAAPPPLRLVAEARARFPTVWVVPAGELGRALGPDVTPWMIGHEARMFLRLVNVTGDALRPLELELEDGGPIALEARVRVELPFALDELAEDRVYELLPAPVPGRHLRAAGGERWAVPDASYDPAGERAVVRSGWVDLVDAYVNARTSNQRARQEQTRHAFRSLLWRGDQGPRRLRPWALLCVQSLAAEILRVRPSRARAYGVDALRGHPQCFPSLARRLKRL